MSERRFIELVISDAGDRCRRWAYGYAAIAASAGVAEPVVHRAIKAGDFRPDDLGSVARWISARWLDGHSVVKTVVVEKTKKEKGRSYGRITYDLFASGYGTWEECGATVKYGNGDLAAKCYARHHGLPWPPVWGAIPPSVGGASEDSTDRRGARSANH